MKQIDFNSIEGLQAFQSEINKQITKRIDEAKLDEKIKEISNLSFSKLRTLFENISANLFDSPDGKKILGRYVKTIRENKDLRRVYLLTDLIKEGTSSDNLDLYLMNATSIFKSNKVKIDEGTKKLGKIVAEGIKLANLSVDEIDKIISQDFSLMESINYIITNEQNIKNLNEWVENANVVVNFLKENKKAKPIEESIENNGDSPKALFDSLVENIKNSDMSNWERSVAEDITVLNLSNSSKPELFEKYKNECINAINEAISKVEDIETKSKLTLMEQQMQKKNFNEETFVDDLLKLSELKALI